MWMVLLPFLWTGFRSALRKQRRIHAEIMLTAAEPVNNYVSEWITNLIWKSSQFTCAISALELYHAVNWYALSFVHRCLTSVYHRWFGLLLRLAVIIGPADSTTGRNVLNYCMRHHVEVNRIMTFHLSTMTWINLLRKMVADMTLFDCLIICAPKMQGWFDLFIQ